MRMQKILNPSIAMIAVCSLALCGLVSCTASLRAGEKTPLEICTVRRGDDGLTLLLADELRRRLDKAPSYGSGCADPSPTTLYILQIKDWREINGRVWMTAKIELARPGMETEKLSTSCWEDDVDECVSVIYAWLGERLSG